MLNKNIDNRTLPPKPLQGRFCVLGCAVLFLVFWYGWSIDVGNSEMQSLFFNFTLTAQGSRGAENVSAYSPKSVVPPSKKQVTSKKVKQVLLEQTIAFGREVSAKPNEEYPSIKSRTCRFIPDEDKTGNGTDIEFSSRYFQTLKMGIRIPPTFQLSGLSKTVAREGKPVKIYWERDAYTSPRYENMKNCETKCIVTQLPSEADFLISTKKPMEKLNAKQKTVYFSRESLYHHGEHVAEFDLTMDLGPFSNIPITATPANFYKNMHRLPIPSIENVKKRKLAVWIARNCDESDESSWGPSWGRMKYVKTLTNYMKIDCPGKCNNNIAAEAAGFGSRRDYEDNYKGFSNYMFVFALHNALDNVNVDEKLYYPYLGNSVPVVVGPDTIYSMQPGEQSFIDATVYKTPQDLAKKLIWYQNNPKEYISTFFRYRKKSPDAPEKKLQEQFEEAGIFGQGIGCRICACKARADCMRKRNVSRCGYRLPLR